MNTTFSKLNTNDSIFYLKIMKHLKYWISFELKTKI